MGGKSHRNPAEALKPTLHVQTTIQYTRLNEFGVRMGKKSKETQWKSICGVDGTMPRVGCLPVSLEHVHPGLVVLLGLTESDHGQSMGAAPCRGSVRPGHCPVWHPLSSRRTPLMERVTHFQLSQMLAREKKSHNLYKDGEKAT